jgi:hypothetical protein
MKRNREYSSSEDSEDDFGYDTQENYYPLEKQRTDMKEMMKSNAMQCRRVLQTGK